MNRRGFITGLISLVAAPAIVRAGSLMPIKAEPLVALRTSLPPATWRSLNQGELYGRSPMLDALPYLRFEDSRRILTLAQYAKIIMKDDQ